MAQEGDFTFIQDLDIREMLKDAYNAITVTNNWEFIKKDPGEGGFMYCHDAAVDEIAKAMSYGGHSGASFGCTLRYMQSLANKGWHTWVQTFQQ